MDPLRMPLGLVLPGGGALCAWQAGALEALAGGGLKFDHVVGVSGGALNGGAYYAGRLPEEMRHWRDASGIRALALDPKLTPLSLCAIQSVWNLVEYALDDEKVKREGICDLTVLTLRVEDNRTIYSRFTPHGARGWDGPLAARLVASAAIPVIYPPVKIDGKLYRDGGARGVEPAHFDALSACRDVVVIHPVRPDERGRKHFGLWARREQAIRELSLAEVEEGLACLKRLPEPPRILNLYPSRTLDYSMLGFTTKNCLPAVEQGSRDGRAFLELTRATVAA